MEKIKIDETLIFTGLDGNTREDILSAMADNLHAHGYVKESYKNAVIQREQRFATGLPTAGCGVAIPHTDIEHVNRAAISIAVLKEDVDFVIMGEEAECVPVKLVFMLAVKEQHSQLEMLQQLMAIFQDHEALDYLVGVADKTKIRAFIIKKLGLEGGENK